MYKIVLSGQISKDGDISAAYVRDEFQKATGNDIVIELNSQGGSIFEGREIKKIIEAYQGNVTIEIASLAASMASVITTAADEVIVYSDSVYMMHRASGLTLGNKNDHDKTSEMLRRLDDQMAEDYAGKSGSSTAEMLKLMDAETWLYGHEILDQGFANTYTDTASTAGQPDSVIAAKARFAAEYLKPDASEILELVAAEARERAEIAKIDKVLDKLYPKIEPKKPRKTNPILDEALTAALIHHSNKKQRGKYEY